SNDLTSYKAFLDSGESGIESHVNDIVYNYGIYPRFFRSDTSDGIVELGASFSSGDMNSMMSALSSLGMSGNGSTSFTEMLNNRELLESQYDVIAGRWPSSYDEVVLVLSSRGRLTDFTLYDLGILDPKEFQEIVESVASEEEYTIPDTTVELTYDDALGLTFRAVVPAECYRLSETGDTWTDMSDDEAFMRGVLDNSVELRVVGVIRPSETTDSPTMSEGIAYTHELTEELIRRATSTEIVQQQLADPDVDVFTGETFESLRDGTADAFQLDDLFTIDQEALENAFDFDSSALSGLGSGLDLSDISIDPSALSFDPSKIQVDTSSLSQTFDNDTLASLLAGVPAPDLSDLQVSLDAAQMAAISNASTSISAGFIPWLGENHPDVEITEDTDLSPYIQEYLATEQVQAMIAETGEALGPEFQEQISSAVERYLSDQVVPYLQGSLSELAAQAAQAMTAQLAVALQQQMASATQSIASQLSQQIGGALSSQMSQLSSALEDAFSVDADAFSNAIQFNMDAEDLTSLLTNYAQASQLTLDNNLIKLGYADFDRPRSIDIYPVSFDDKEAVLDIIDTYNEQMVAEGCEEQKITYTDIMGALLSSVSDIVNTISTVLIAFVSISLVVSSIMIGIITYISVLERKKEIGILRAMGASKGNVANVFNAETFIEGLIAGIFAIAVVLAASVPVNAYILETRNVPNIMQLPAREALILIGISVGLTVLAGLIPSSAASRRDPVEALRSE
ncbi:MAG: ABC transporter permease, partial [Atopobiaceae bacterium]|nr:ABC transporter permease [Atopobiaceae bacterium]